MFRYLYTKQFAIFLVTGTIAAAANFFSRIAYSIFLPFYISVALSYVTGMVVSFILMRKIVFHGHTTPFLKSLITFVIINLFSFIQNWVITMTMEYAILPKIGITAYSADIASLTGIAFPVITSFLGYKKYSFSTR